MPSLLQVAVRSELASTVVGPGPNIGTSHVKSHVKKTKLDKLSSQSTSTAKGSKRSNITIPHANEVPSKLENPHHVATSSRQPPEAKELIRFPLRVAPLSMMNAESIRTLVTPRPTPTASLRSMKRHRIDSDDDNVVDDSIVGTDRDGYKRPKLGMPVAIHDPGDKWATVTGKKKYAGFHFKKKEVER